MILVTGAATATAETFDTLKAACLAHTRRSRGEPGCLSHDVFVDAENPLRLCFFERWADRVALMAHFAVPESRDFVWMLRAQAVQAEGPLVYEASALDF